MASNVIVLTHPGSITNVAWGSIPAGSSFLDAAGKLYFKVDSSTCFDLENKQTITPPASGYECDVMISATYK